MSVAEMKYWSLQARMATALYPVVMSTKAAVVIVPSDCQTSAKKQIIFAQILLAAIDQTRDVEETAWGMGDVSMQFSEKNGWAAYNEYTCL